MLFIGMIIAAIILILSFTLIGSYGIAFLVILSFGLIFSTYQRNKQIYEDIKIIREKLGLLREEEIVQNEIDKSIEDYNKIKHDPQLISERNKEIEDELEKHIINIDDDLDDKESKDEKKE